MSTTVLRREDRERPLVALLWSVPLLAEALRPAIEFADVHVFASAGGDVPGLLHWLRPDAVVVDSDAAAAGAEAFAADEPLPVLHVSVSERSLRLLRAGVWEDAGGDGDPAPETVRNVLAGALFSGGVV